MREPLPFLGQATRTSLLPPLPLLAGLLLAVVCSIALVWLLAGASLVATAYGGTLLVVVILGLIMARRNEQLELGELAQPDWSVTVAAIEDPSQAVAITDRANRLTCANRRFIDWFGEANAPPNIPLEAGASTLR